MPFGMLFSPERSQQRGPLPAQVQGPRNLGMTGKTKGNHQFWVAISRLAVVDCNRPLPSLQRGAARNGTPIPVTGQHRFPLSTEVFFVLPFQRVASRTKSQGENFIIPAGAADRPLYEARHYYITHSAGSFRISTSTSQP